MEQNFEPTRQEMKKLREEGMDWTDPDTGVTHHIIIKMRICADMKCLILVLSHSSISDIEQALGLSKASANYFCLWFVTQVFEFHSEHAGATRQRQ